MLMQVFAEEGFTLLVSGSEQVVVKGLPQAGALPQSYIAASGLHLSSCAPEHDAQVD